MMSAWADIPMLSSALLGPLALFSLVTSITPGPNNAMLASSGLTFGFRRTLPHLFGVNLGCTLMLVLIGLGLGNAFLLFPQIYAVLKYVGTAYLLYLAWKIARSGPLESGSEEGRPLTFFQAALFQWVNPKAWVMNVGIIATYTPQNDFFMNLWFASTVFLLVNLPSIAVWVSCGASLRTVLRQPKAVRAFNLGMALLLVASLYPIVPEIFKQL